MSTTSEFPLLGEPLALDLINTRPVAPGGAPRDLLDTPAALRAWIDLERHRLPDMPSRTDQALLEQVLDIREHVASALDCARDGREPPRKTLSALNTAQRSAPTWQRLSWDGQRLVATEQRDGTPPARVVAALAEAAIDLLIDPRVGDIRRCANPDCVLVFLPENPRRQWCSSARCGNRVRVARYHQRHKSQAPEAVQ